VVTTILIVEDDAVLRTLLTVFLATEDNVVLAVDGLQVALDALKARPFELVISDVHLGDGSGLEVARAARTRFGAGVTVVLTSGDDLAPSVAQAAGADEFVLKPFYVPDLIDRCAALMARAGRQLARSELCLRAGRVA
jgi:DNA-binding response OmpR family regulator